MRFMAVDNTQAMLVFTVHIHMAFVRHAGALQVMISRISGICIGVGLSLLISVMVYPSSATVKALACMRQVRPHLIANNAVASTTTTR